MFSPLFALRVCEDELLRNLGNAKRIHISFGCDCTGADAPGEAWQSIKRVMQRPDFGGLDLDFEHVFASEASPLPTSFLTWLSQLSSWAALCACSDLHLIHHFMRSTCCVVFLGNLSDPISFGPSFLSLRLL